jgi:hypothetical protein
MLHTQSNQAQAEYLQGIKAGDAVYILRGRMHHRVRVSHVTKTQIVCGHTRYLKNSGRSVAQSGVYYSSIVEPTPEVIREARNNYLNEWATSALPGQFITLSLEQKEQVFALARSLLKSNREAQAEEVTP